MNKKYIFILIFIAVLLAVIGGELFYLQQLDIKTKNNETVPVSTTQKGVTEKNGDIKQIERVLNTYAPYPETNFLRNALTLFYEKKSLADLTISMRYIGTASAVFNDGELKDGTKYTLRIDMVIPGLSSQIPIYYAPYDIAKVSYYASQDKSIPPRPLSEIKVGDSIEVVETYDLNGYHLVQAVLTKLN